MCSYDSVCNNAVDLLGIAHAPFVVYTGNLESSFNKKIPLIKREVPSFCILASRYHNECNPLKHHNFLCSFLLFSQTFKVVFLDPWKCTVSFVSWIFVCLCFLFLSHFSTNNFLDRKLDLKFAFPRFNVYFIFVYCRVYWVSSHNLYSAKWGLAEPCSVWNTNKSPSFKDFKIRILLYLV